MAGFFKKLVNKITNKAEIDWDELEADLISSDLGARLSMTIIDELQALGRKINAEDVVETTKKHIASILPDDLPAIQPRTDGKPHVVVMVGVNGTGKTTSTAKLAHHLRSQGHSVMVAAADTFRAAAVEQLEVWAERINIPIMTGAANADPSSVCYKAHEVCTKEGIDFLICDTAGRLHTRHNLMEELAKIERTIAKQDETAPHTKMIVVDATTGSNALQQAKEFNKAIELDSLVVTKLDGSGKGGIIVSIYQELNIPARFIGLGEEPEMFQVFNKEQFTQEIM